MKAIIRAISIALLASAASLSNAAEGQIIIGQAQPIDGDSLMVGTVEVRLFGVDAPEGRQTCERAGVAWRCGEEARERLFAMIAGRTVRCQPQDTDHYGRTVAVCTAGTLDLAGAMVEAGFAVALADFADTYVADEQRARMARVGIWGSQFQMPAEWRAAQPQVAQSSGPSAVARPPVSPTIQNGGGCRIKGNRNRRGEWIYHLPGRPYYDETRAEQWFCTEADARAAGYRRSRAQ